MYSEATTKYSELIERFLASDLDVTAFEAQYLALFKNETCIFPPEIFDVLDTLFADVDAFCADDSIRTADGIDEGQLRESCRRTLMQLRTLKRGAETDAR
jgi:hypothetical protein